MGRQRRYDKHCTAGIINELPEHDGEYELHRLLGA